MNECKKCGSKWESIVKSERCPFCGELLVQPKSGDNMSVSDAIESIISLQGIDILDNTKRINSYIMDLVQGYDREKKLFRILCSTGNLDFALKLLKTSDTLQKEVIIKKQIRILIDDTFMAEENAIEALNIVLKGIGEKEIEFTKPQKLEPLIQGDLTVLRTFNSLPNSDRMKPTHQSSKGHDSDEIQYLNACRLKEEACVSKDLSKLEHAIDLFSLVENYNDSKDLIHNCELLILRIRYENALKEKQKVYSYKDIDGIERILNNAISQFESLNGFEDSLQQIDACKELKSERIYEIAVDIRTTADKYSDETIFSKALLLFDRIIDYKDAAQQAEYCSKKLEAIHKDTLYQKALYYFEKKDVFSLERAMELLIEVGNWKNSQELIEECRKNLKEAKLQKEKQDMINENEYSRAVALINKNDVNSLEQAISILENMPRWKDNKDLNERCKRKLSLMKKKTTVRTSNPDYILLQRKNQGLCQYCGGDFKGLFIKKCTKCGKEKDY